MLPNVNDKFSTWLLNELQQRDWTQAVLARKSGLSRAAISNIISNNRNPNPESCAAIAKAFKIQPETVLRQAGHLPPLYDDPDTMAEWVHLYFRLPPAQRALIRRLARILQSNPPAR